ncbi:DNA-invertase hin [Stieleria neptunia]|uniref:DNA-invertase hin n=2 Tax=Stieleria neptunia TaxID=2527979 RepID=A0A518HNV2_9BACT|nr:DNA-invertase hin [Stieleria neptunia]
MNKQIAVYCRVSSKTQDTASQKPDLERWINAFAPNAPVKWYEDQFSGRTMDRPGWSRLMQDIDAGRIDRIVVWRLDRLGRTARGLTALFDELPRRGIGLVSVKDGLDFDTAAGRLMANVLASVAQYETEIRAERVRAGQQKARKRGKTWGGSEPGRLLFLSSDQVETILHLHDQGKPKAAIARACGVSRPTVYRILCQNDAP